MPTRSCLVILHNETPHVLSRPDARLTGGKWGRDGLQHPPEIVPAGATIEMGSDSSGIMTGTEGSVRYQAGDDPNAFVFLQWDNPFLGRNSYDHQTDAGHHVFRSGGGGNNATVHFTLRTSAVRSTGFLPSLHGFRFANNFGDRPYSLPLLRGSALDQKFGNAKNGLCGGMVFAARDYFEAGWGVPESPTPPLGEEDPFFVYLVDRLFATFTPSNVTLLLKLMSPLLHDTDERSLNWLDLLGPGYRVPDELLRAMLSSRAQIVTETEWPLVRADIDAGRPSPLMLCMVRSALPGDIGKNHQVLVYAYRASGDDIELHAYDPNTDPAQPDDVRIRFSVRTASDPLVFTHNVQVRDDDGVSLRPINSFARLAYVAQNPAGPRGEWPGSHAGGYPRQVLLNATAEEGGGEVVESGTKEFAVGGGECGYRSFAYELIRQSCLIAASAKVLGYRSPHFTWRINGVTVSDGGPTTLVVQANVRVRGDAAAGEVDEDQEAPVNLTTTRDGANLTVRNAPADGSYTLHVEVDCVESGAGPETTSRASVDLRVLGDRLDVPGLAHANAMCMMESLRSLQQQIPTEAELEASIMAAIKAMATRPPDPLWDPDPVLAEAGWETLPDDERDEIVAILEDGSAERADAALADLLAGADDPAWTEDAELAWDPATRDEFAVVDDSAAAVRAPGWDEVASATESVTEPVSEAADEAAATADPSDVAGEGLGPGRA